MYNVRIGVKIFKSLWILILSKFKLELSIKKIVQMMYSYRFFGFCKNNLQGTLYLTVER